MTNRTYCILALGLCACMITAWFALEDVPYCIVMAGITLVWLGLVVERRRNMRRAR